MIKFYRWVKERIQNGRAREILQESRWIAGYILRYRGSVLIHVLLGMISIIMTLGSSIASKFLIDAVIGYNSGTIGAAAAAMIGMRLGSIAMRAASSRISAVLNIRIQNEVRGDIYGRILKTDWQSLDKFKSGDLLSRIGSDADAVSGGITGFVPSLVSNIVQLIGSFCIMLYYDPIMALLALVGVPLTAGCSVFLVRRMRRHNREMKEAYSDVLSYQQDSFQNITSIKAFGAVKDFIGGMSREQDKYREKYLDYSKFSVWASTLMSLLSLLAYALCFGWGVYRLWMGGISYGDMTMFMQLSSLLGSAFSAVIGLVPSWISVTTSAGRIMAVVELPEERTEDIPELADEQELTLELRNISFNYDGGAPLLSGINMTVEPGELIALTGPSGEGKTTLLRILLGLVEPSGGSAELTGKKGKYTVGASTRAAFSYVPQGSQLFSGTVAENLRISAPNATDEELVAALKAACAYDFVMALPNGLEHVIGGRDKHLSEGQAQRITIARALLKKAPILLLDEATSALDTETEKELLEGLMGSKMIKSCILVTHRPAGKALCSRSYHMSNGSLREVE